MRQVPQAGGRRRLKVACATSDRSTTSLTARCRSCGQTGEIEPYLFRCGTCEGTDLVVVTGREMMVSEVELEEEERKL